MISIVLRCLAPPPYCHTNPDYTDAEQGEGAGFGGSYLPGGNLPYKVVVVK